MSEEIRREKPADGEPLKNPLPVPKKRRHADLDFDITEIDNLEFDIQISDDDDFDI